MGTVFHYNDLKTVEEVVIAIENFEQNEQNKNYNLKMQAFANKYGSTRDENTKKGLESMGYSGQYRASFPYTELESGIGKDQKNTHREG